MGETAEGPWGNESEPEEIRVVYGPPTKVKTKCAACGFVWITGGLGGSYPDACPQCGSTNISVLQSEPITGFFGLMEPFEHPEKPQLFDESQVVQLLRCRKGRRREFDDGELAAMLSEIGITLPPALLPEELTERQADQLNLAESILSTKGSNIRACRTDCPRCGGRAIMALSYYITKGFVAVEENAHAKVGRDAVVSLRRRPLAVDRLGSPTPAFCCMECGLEFGEFSLPNC